LFGYVHKVPDHPVPHALFDCATCNEASQVFDGRVVEIEFLVLDNGDDFGHKTQCVVVFKTFERFVHAFVGIK
jgi:hypothetical protein